MIENGSYFVFIPKPEARYCRLCKKKINKWLFQPPQDSPLVDAQFGRQLGTGLIGRFTGPVSATRIGAISFESGPVAKSEASPVKAEKK